MSRLRNSPSGPFVVPADLAANPVPGLVLGNDATGLIWVPPTFTPVMPTYRISAVFNVVIPELAAQERGKATFSTLGTALEGITQATPLLVDALEESMPPGVNNGMYITCRIPSASTISLYFIGRITTKTLPYLCTVFL